jgi:phosphate transport system permease protein
VSFSGRSTARFFRFAAFGSGILTLGIFVMMLCLAWPLFSSGRFFSILFQEWNPAAGRFGIYPMMLGSLSIASLALCISIPVSLGTAFVTATLAPWKVRRGVLAMVRFMAGIPTVIYGFVAVFLLVPFMREQITGGSGFNILTAAIVLALLISPTMIIFFVNGLSNVKPAYCLAVDALGARPVQKLIFLLLPQAWPAIVSGIIMGMGRAMGDTLISLMLAGNSIALPEGVSDGARTLTAHIALVIAADLQSMEFATIFSSGIVLYVFTVLIVTALRALGFASFRRLSHPEK